VKSLYLPANNELQRDFTYVDDVSTVICELLDPKVKFKKPEILNVAGGSPHTFSKLFDNLKSLELMPKIKQSQPDSLDVHLTHGSISKT
jgi:nucleoside-diphosphate-sugar epimerase